MVFRRCPQCGSTSDDAYGFCIKCGHEFPKIEVEKGTCPLCGFTNPDEADFCVKCGTPLIFKNQLENNTVINPIVEEKPNFENNQIPHIVIKKEVVGAPKKRTTFQTILVYAGYIFSILGGLLGLIIGIYLATRKDRSLKKHGYIQIAIFIFYVALIAGLYFTGHIPQDAINNYVHLLNGNFTGF